MSGRVVSPAKWVSAHLPTREKLETNRWIRPFAHQVLKPDLWRFNRRSVPRGVALGLFTGISVPFAHSPIAALTAVFVRANVPVAIATTWLSNPATWALMFPAALWLSRLEGFHADVGSFRWLMDHHAGLGAWVHWLLSSAAPALMAGLFTLAVIVSSTGYLVSGLAWRAIVLRKLRRRRLARARG